MAKKRPKMVDGKEIGSCEFHAEFGELEEEKGGFETAVKEDNVVRIGREAPDFELSSFHNGRFESIKLSNYRGKWVLLCFYPGDFTFV